MRKYYHITSGESAPVILQTGLEPRFGQRTRRVSPWAGYAIFVTPSVDAALELQGLTFWSSHPEFLSHGQVILEVETDEKPSRDTEFKRGLVLRKPIPADRVRLLHSIPPIEAPRKPG